MAVLVRGAWLSTAIASFGSCQNGSSRISVLAAPERTVSFRPGCPCAHTCRTSETRPCAQIGLRVVCSPGADCVWCCQKGLCTAVRQLIALPSRSGRHYITESLCLTDSFDLYSRDSSRAHLQIGVADLAEDLLRDGAVRRHADQPQVRAAGRHDHAALQGTIVKVPLTARSLNRYTYNFVGARSAVSVHLAVKGRQRVLPF